MGSINVETRVEFVECSLCSRVFYFEFDSDPTGYEDSVQFGNALVQHVQILQSEADAAFEPLRELFDVDEALQAAQAELVAEGNVAEEELDEVQAGVDAVDGEEGLAEPAAEKPLAHAGCESVV